MNTFDDTAKQVEEIASGSISWGLKKGLMGVVLYFLYYQRFTGNKRYEETAFNLLENILSGVSVNQYFDYATGIVGIGNTLLFLKEEGFMDMDSNDFFNDLDTIVLRKLKSAIVVNFSHDTGIIGLCHYAIHRPIQMEAIQQAFHHLIKGFEKKICDIDPVFLFPSEILEDIKLFLLEITPVEEISEQITAIHQRIERFESHHSILQSNCPDYRTIQQLREAEICHNPKEIQFLLAEIANESSDVVLRGLAAMSREELSLPSWWKLF